MLAYRNSNILFWIFSHFEDFPNLNRKRDICFNKYHIKILSISLLRRRLSKMEIHTMIKFIKLIIYSFHNQAKTGNSSTFKFSSTFFSSTFIPLISLMILLSSSETSYWHALSNTASLSLSSITFLSTSYKDSGDKSLRLSNITWTLKGI